MPGPNLMFLHGEAQDEPYIKHYKSVPLLRTNHERPAIGTVTRTAYSYNNAEENLVSIDNQNLSMSNVANGRRNISVITYWRQRPLVTVTNTLDNGK